MGAMMKRTEKYRKAESLAFLKNLPMPYPQDNEHVYEMLENNGFWWNGKKKAWEKESTRPSTTIFADKKGKATGIGRLRLMCHPDEEEAFIEAIRSITNLEIIEVSDKSYKNRNGAGYRTYLTVKRKG